MHRGHIVPKLTRSRRCDHRPEPHLVLISAKIKREHFTFLSNRRNSFINSFYSLCYHRTGWIFIAIFKRHELPWKQNVLQLAKVSTAANRSDLQSFCSQTILSPPFLQFQGFIAYGRSRSVVLRHRRLWSFRFSVATGTAERVPSSHLKTKTFQRVKNLKSAL